MGAPMIFHPIREIACLVVLGVATIAEVCPSDAVHIKNAADCEAAAMAMEGKEWKGMGESWKTNYPHGCIEVTDSGNPTGQIYYNEHGHSRGNTGLHVVMSGGGYESCTLGRDDL